MVSHLLKDVISGLKLILLSGKSRHDSKMRIRFFLGGFFLTFVSSFTIFATTVYNIAIAGSNTEIIVNAVVILFVVEMDEQFHRAAVAANSKWVKSLAWKQQVEAEAAHHQGDNEDDKNDSVSPEWIRLEQLETRVQDTERALSPEAERDAETSNTDLDCRETRFDVLERRMENMERTLESNLQLETRLKNVESRLLGAE